MRHTAGLCLSLLAVLPLLRAQEPPALTPAGRTAIELGLEEAAPPAAPDPAFEAAVAALPDVLVSWGTGARRQLTRAELKPSLLQAWQQLTAGADPPDRERFRAEARRLAETFVNRLLLLELAAADGILPDLKAAEANIRQERGPDWNDVPIDPETVRFLADALAIDRWVMDKVLPAIAITPPDIEAYYQANREEFAAPEAVRAAAILLPLAAEANDAERQKVRDKAQDLRRQLVAGADFAELAHRHSDGPSADAGGDIGFVPKGGGGQLEAALFKLKDGEISAVVETAAGLLILKRTGWRPAGVQPLDDRLRQDLKLSLQADKSRAAFQRRLEDHKQAQKLAWGF